MTPQFEFAAAPAQRPTSRSWHRRATIFASLLVALSLPAVALANHLFDDVPTSHTFHDSITNLAMAGVTAGCDADSYCPQSPVTRAQMAAFLNRGLGRIAEASVQAPTTGTAQVTLGELTITPGISPGALAGANQFVRAELTGSLRFTNVTNCPCTVAVYLTADGSPLTQVASATTVSAANQYSPLTTSGVIQISGSVPVTIRAIAYYVGGGTTTTAYTYYGNLDAETFPFGSTGGEILSVNGAAGEENPLAVPPD